MRYLPTIELTPQVRLLLARGALHLQPGQWVRDGQRGIGRFLRTDARTGTPHVSWVRPEDRFEDAAKRFGRACQKGFIGKYARRYDGVKQARAADRDPFPFAGMREPVWGAIPF